jgi:hypothetical protein
VVFGFDDAVCRRTLAGDVAVEREVREDGVGRCGFYGKVGTYRSTISPFSFSMVALVLGVRG